MSQPLLEITSERRTCLLTRTQEPAMISAKQNQASSGLPSSTEAAPLTGKPKMLSHSETGLEQPSTSQSTGSQSAPLTSGFSRMSRRNSHTMTAIVRKRARDDESPSPNKVAIWGSTKSTDDKFLSYLGVTSRRTLNNSRKQLKGAEQPRGITDIEAGYGDVLGHNGARPDDHMVADCNREHRGVRTDGYMTTKLSRPPQMPFGCRSPRNKKIIDEHHAMRNKAIASNGDEFTDK